jgi:DNA-binding NtrC family response regulator
MSHRLLIIEDDYGLNQMLALHFEDQGYEVSGVDNCASALAQLQGQDFDFVLLDQQLPDGLGIDLLPQLLHAVPGLPVIMMTGQHDLELAIEAIKLGAADFVHKPVSTQALQAAADKALARKQSEDTRKPASTQLSERDLIGRSAAMLEVSKQIALSAQHRANVLIQGESGTGKEVVARLIHQHSGRSGPFVAVNCAAIVDTLLESELFGHEKGAFTGADRSKPGRFELAAGGTLFLDEIGELALPLQAKLLRALQERVIERVGGTAPIEVETRVVAATHRDLFQLAAEGKFREDLAYRLQVVGIRLPPLRERPEDIPLLIGALLERIAQHNEQATPAIDQAAVHKLSAHTWPGNVRELENVLTQALVQARGGNISAEHIHCSHAQAPPAAHDQASMTAEQTVLRTLEDVEAEHIQRVLHHTGGHKGRTCEVLGISRPALDRKILKYRLTVG